jgi:hypothetical protein
MKGGSFGPGDPHGCTDGKAGCGGGSCGEAALAEGLRADLDGDRRRAAQMSPRSHHLF